MMVNIRWITRTAILCILVGTCIAQFQQNYHRQTHQRNNQPSQQQVFNQQTNQYNQQPNQRSSQQNQYNQNQLNQEQPRQFASSGSCPEPNGRFPVASQCDAYIECRDGVPEEKLCPDGLLFNPEARFNYPCGYPIDVKCSGRSNLQPAKPTEECPHQYGYFKVGDRQNCGKFMNCVEGRAFHFDCPEGLAYSSDTYRCDWPDQVVDCDAEAFLGFSCPTEGQNSFLSSETRFYRSPTDCQRYYVCVDNRPRLQNCGEGHAFSELINACDAAENVTGCEPQRFIDQRFQQVQLDVPQQALRSFNQQPNNYNQQTNAYNQQQSFVQNNQQQSARTQQRSNPSRQKFFFSNKK